MVELLAQSGFPVNPTLLSRVESGTKRYGVVADGYEEVLGLTTGRLRAPIDILCRTFPYSPADMAPDRLHMRGCQDHDTADVIEAVSAASDRVRREDVVGADWLALARALACPRAGGFPVWLLDPWLDRLLSEVGRSVGSAFATRYEALALLRCGPYGAVVLEAGRRWVADPHVQVLYDVMSAMSERPDPAVLAWSCGLLSDPRPTVVHGAVLALENMVEVGGLTSADWDSALAAILAAYTVASPGTDVHASLSKILAGLPAGQRTLAAAECRKRGLMPLVRPRRFTRKGQKEPTNLQWAAVERLAADITDTAGLERQPVLERMLFEALHEHRETRAVTSLFLLAALPFTDIISSRIYAYALDQAADDHRAGMLERLMILQNGAPLAATPVPPDVSDADAVNVHITLLAQSGQSVDREHLDLLLEADERHRRRALYAAGLSGDAALERWATTGPADLRGPAAWWIRNGTRIVDAEGA